MKYLTIVADPPWQQPMLGRYKHHSRPDKLAYPTMPLDEICALPIGDFADNGCHLWLWTTNAFLEQGFEVMRAWGFTYLAPIHWIKPSGFGNYVVHRTQTLLLGYKGRCKFEALRYFPNVIKGAPRKHSQKPAEFYDLVEQVSPEPRLEMFARRKRLGWHAWGNEVFSDVSLTATPAEQHAENIDRG